MANLIAAVNNGPWTTPGTWMTCETGSGAAQLTRSASTETTTSYVWSAAFTCTNLDVMDGVLLCLKRVGVSGTITIAISADNGATAAKEVTVNASDIPADQTMMFFKFPSTLTSDGGADYKIGVKESAGGSGATVYRDATAGNWFRLIRLTAAPGADPAAGDNVFVAGEWTAAATTTAINVVMDSTDSTDHGIVDIGSGGTLTFGVTAATAYVLKASGDINVWSGGTLNVGTVATPMPSNSSGTILLDCASNVQYGLYVRKGGTHVMQGAAKLISTFLAADAAINATTLTTADSTAWLNNDVVAVASTTRTVAQTEAGAVNVAPVGTALTVDGFGGAGGGLAYAHSGITPTRAEILNLTRNVVVIGASASLQGYIYIEATAIVDWDYAEFKWLGSGTVSRRGIDLTTTTGSFNMNASVLHDFVMASSTGVVVVGAATNNITITDTLFYAIHSQAIWMSATSGTWTITGCIFFKNVSGTMVQLSDVGGAFTGNTVVSAQGYGIDLYEAGLVGTFSNNTVHSNTTYGVFIEGAILSGSVISGTTGWRNNDVGIQINPAVYNLTFNGGTFFGNTLASIRFNARGFGISFKSIVSNGDSTFSTVSGVYFTYDAADITFDNCDFSSLSGILTAHTNDVFLLGTNVYLRLLSRDTKLGGTNPITGLSTASIDSSFGVQRFGGTAGDHRWYGVAGIIRTDAVIYRTAAPSERVTPSSATVKIKSAKASKIVDNGGTVTFSVWVRKSAAGDAGGADYNGNQPRLILKANPALGIDADVVLDTMTAAVGNWEQLTGTSAAVTDDGVLQAIVDCDGTAGWINTDDWT